MKVYIVAATAGQYQDALRALGLHDRAAVHLTEQPWARPDGPMYVYRAGEIIKVYVPRLAA